MGAADVVPGVSGGTIAFISGIYEQLISAIKALNMAAFVEWKTHGFWAFWAHVHGRFLVTLLSGIVLSIATFARILAHLLAHYPLLVWGFFFGLIAGSVVFIWRQIPQRGPACWLLLGLGASVVALTAFAPHAVIEPTPWFIFGAGMLAICAMILPGISGSFILVLLGLYPVILDAVAHANVSVLSYFVAGCITGILLFSRLLFWLLSQYRHYTLAVLTGFLVGSLVVVWPWQQIHHEGSPLHGVASLQLLSPVGYGQLVGDSQWLPVVVLMTIGVVLVSALEGAGGLRQDV